SCIVFCVLVCNIKRSDFKDEPCILEGEWKSFHSDGHYAAHFVGCTEIPVGASAQPNVKTDFLEENDAVNGIQFGDKRRHAGTRVKISPCRTRIKTKFFILIEAETQTYFCAGGIDTEACRSL